MDPLIIPLALGCILTLSHIDRAMTVEDGQTPNGIYYRTVALTDANGHHRIIEPSARGQGFSPGSAFNAGPSPDRLFASYVVLTYAAGHNVGDVRFLSAKTCAPVRFVVVRNGATVGAVKYEGWKKDSPHGVSVWRDAREYELGLPIDEARVANPGILDTE